MPQRKAIAEALALIFQGRDLLMQAFPESKRRFTIDGRLVGDIGEVIAELEYDVELDQSSKPIHDGKTADGRPVQVKATFKKHLAFRRIPHTCLGFLLNEEDGTWEVVFNGPGQMLREAFQHRKGIDQQQLSFPIARLRELNKLVPDDQRVPMRR